jgi:hypothetical protein
LITDPAADINEEDVVIRDRLLRILLCKRVYVQPDLAVFAVIRKVLPEVRECLGVPSGPGESGEVGVVAGLEGSVLGVGNILVFVRGEELGDRLEGVVEIVETGGVSAKLKVLDVDSVLMMGTGHKSFFGHGLGDVVGGKDVHTDFSDHREGGQVAEGAA